MCLASCMTGGQKKKSDQPQKDDCFHILFNSNGGSSVEEKLVKKGEKIDKPDNPVKEGYNFGYWSYQNVEFLFDAFVPSSDMILDANWIICSYDVTVSNNIDYGIVSGADTYTFNATVNLTASPKTGYKFLGWLEGDKVVSENLTYSFNMPSHNINLTTKYDLQEFNTRVDNNPSFGTVVGEGMYKYLENVALSVTPNTGYIFDGWYEGNTLVCSTQQYSFKMPNYDLQLSTRYKKQKILLTVLNSDSMAGTITGDLSGEYDYGTQVTVTANPNHPYLFNGWFINNEVVSNLLSYTFVLTSEVSITAKWGLSSFSVSLFNENENAGTLTGDGNYLFGTPVTLQASVNTGYSFRGWYKGNSLFSSNANYSFNMPGENLNLTAKWDFISYNISYVLNGGVNNPSNPSNYNVESNIEFAPATKKGYTFLGWFDNNNNQIYSISSGTMGPVTLTAHWNDGNSYVVTLDANNGSVYPTQVTVNYDQNYSLPIPTRNGYEFNGWYSGITKINNSGTWTYDSNKSIVASWTPIDYSITYNLNNGTNDPSNPNSYTIEDSFVFKNPSREGYSFAGWFDNSDNQIAQIAVGTTGSLALTAHWSVNQNVLTVTSEDTSKGTVSITSGSGYSDESITVVATPIGDCVFKGWYHDDSKVSDDATYTFTMPTNDYSLVAHFFTKAEEEKEAQRQRDIAHGIIPALSKDGKTITYGLYPQTNVSDSSLVSSLNALTTPESNGWYLYNDDYYAKLTANPYDSSYEFDNGTNIVSGTTYWFKCEPIVWNIISNDSGKYYILSSVLLDAYCFYNSTSTRTIGENTIYPNNYEYSDIRIWLNNDFYNSAFALDNNNIQITTVDNSAATTDSTSNPYACNNTQDRVFLPSYKDYINSSYGFSTSINSSNTRYCKTTDWARARGAIYFTRTIYFYTGFYWTRSPLSSDPYVWGAGCDGSLHYFGVLNTYFGVRPGLSIDIS